MALVKLHGKEYHFEKDHVVDLLKGVDPQPVHTFSINIHGKDYPIKQAISAATGLSSERFSATEAHEFLRRLGFVIENHDQRMRRHKKGRRPHS